jgi:DNA-binding NarL/FixJ family response regulator
MSKDDGEVTVVIGRLDPLLSRGLETSLQADPRLHILAVDLNERALERLVALRRPKLVVLSELVNNGLLARLASLETSPRVVVVAGRPTSLFGSLLLAAGVSCLAQDAALVDILAAIHGAARGEPTFVAGNGPQSSRRARAQLLTKRETEVFHCLSRDMAAAEIALELRLSVATVRTHTRAIFRKLGVKDRRELGELRLGM